MFIALAPDHFVTTISLMDDISVKVLVHFWCQNFVQKRFALLCNFWRQHFVRKTHT